MNKLPVVVLLIVVFTQLLVQIDAKCGPEETPGCAPCCPEEEVTCENKVAQKCPGVCSVICKLQCNCKSGYFKDTETGKCIKECPEDDK
ncbi:unnamed protein product [Diabrotica balteata]|uniref:Uncharacterized protein n=1 Tax=Diabrotica balteata TaxID=107213 RepID=A0A9P0DUD8_DIABA|nr:unnamed protein product [Diabrotica balteata]